MITGRGCRCRFDEPPLVSPRSGASRSTSPPFVVVDDGGNDFFADVAKPSS